MKCKLIESCPPRLWQRRVEGLSHSSDWHMVSSIQSKACLSYRQGRKQFIVLTLIKIAYSHEIVKKKPRGILRAQCVKHDLFSGILLLFNKTFAEKQDSPQT